MKTWGYALTSSNLTKKTSTYKHPNFVWGKHYCWIKQIFQNQLYSLKKRKNKHLSLTSPTMLDINFLQKHGPHLILEFIDLQIKSLVFGLFFFPRKKIPSEPTELDICSFWLTQMSWQAPGGPKFYLTRIPRSAGFIPSIFGRLHASWPEGRSKMIQSNTRMSQEVSKWLANGL